MPFPRDLSDVDPDETREWLDALEYLLDNHGVERRTLLERLSARMAQTGAPAVHDYDAVSQHDPVQQEAFMPGDLFMERRIRSLIRWNALAMVMRANQSGEDLGGHIATFSSAATLYDVGFNYFFRAPSDEHPGDLVYFQGHCSPGIYARSFLEGRIDESVLDLFDAKSTARLSSYPHPWLMPDYWQFPTVSMGLGPIQAIYQAHVMKYLDSRGLVPDGRPKGVGVRVTARCDEPESLGVLGCGARAPRQLDFRISCNLQRLDGPVRGNGKIIQELEGVPRRGWNVIKVVGPTLGSAVRE
jgi:pyruvate dehydrogenase E1 component